MTCNHGPFEPNRPSNEENELWDNMIAKYGVYEIGRRMARRKTYRDYVSHWPYDHTESVVSLDVLHEAGFDPPTVEDIAMEYMVDDMTEEFLDTLTAKQHEIIVRLMDGWRPKEMFTDFGHKHTGGIRYHKYLIRQKLRKRYPNIGKNK